MLRTGLWDWCRARNTWRGCCGDLKGWVEHAFHDLEERFGFPAFGRTTAIKENGARFCGADAASRDGEPPALWQDTIEELDRARGLQEPDRKVETPALPGTPQEAEYDIQFDPGPELFRLGLDPVLVLRDLAQLGSLTAEADLSRLPALASLDAERSE